MSEKKKGAAPEINEPEQLYEYVKIIKPGTWMLLLAAVLLFVVYVGTASANELVDGMNCGCICDNGVLSVYVGEDDLDYIRPGMEVLVDSYIFHVTELAPVSADELDDYYLYVTQASDIDHGESIYRFVLNSDIPDGMYTAFIVAERNSLGSYMLGTEL